ncbi:MAG: hypothetical protein AAF936_17540 [Pseudomonadota bacterium]
MRKFLIISSILAMGCGSAYAEKVQYEYDVHGRLIKVQRCGADDMCDGDNDDVDTDYKYDAADNRTEKKVDVDPPP